MTAPKTFDPVWEDSIYGKGHHLNRYPFDAVVSFLFRSAPRDRPRRDVRVLEVGSGAANNLWMAAREGFAVTGLDASESAVAFARKRFAADGLAGEFVVGDFTELPFPDGAFDLAIDRGSISCCGFEAGRRAIAEVRRVLAPGGKLFFNPYSSTHSGARCGPPQADGTIVMASGPLAGVGQIAFYDRGHIETAFRGGWSILSMVHVEATDHAAPEAVVLSDWRVVAEKVGA